MDVDLWTGFRIKKSAFLCRFWQFGKCSLSGRFVDMAISRHLLYYTNSYDGFSGFRRISLKYIENG